VVWAADFASDIFASREALIVTVQSGRSRLVHMQTRHILHALIAALFSFGLTNAALVRAQTGPTPSAKPHAAQVSFEVASVKRNMSGVPPAGDALYSNVPLGPGDEYSPTGGLLSATNIPLFTYITFAYDVSLDQLPALLSEAPKWLVSERYDIQARTEGNPTKDEMRLMMRALLADRFKLAAHVETHQGPVLALVLAKPGTLGPGLRRHSEDRSPCRAGSSSGANSGKSESHEDESPPPCGTVGGLGILDGRQVIGGRDVTMALIASSFTAPASTSIDRRVIDKTGLTGTFDCRLEWVPANASTRPDVKWDESGPSFIEAVKEQLGLKLEPATGAIDRLVIDHVGEPSAN
jgi:uncharacterized protein (TIGR03435 family)